MKRSPAIPLICKQKLLTLVVVELSELGVHLPDNFRFVSYHGFISLVLLSLHLLLYRIVAGGELLANDVNVVLSGPDQFGTFGQVL